MYNGKWQNKSYFEWWASVLDPDYDRDGDIEPARVFCCMICCPVNFNSGTSALLNQDVRADNPEMWDKAQAWLRSLTWPPENKLTFEDQANEFLCTLTQIQSSD